MQAVKFLLLAVVAFCLMIGAPGQTTTDVPSVFVPAQPIVQKAQATSVAIATATTIVGATAVTTTAATVAVVQQQPTVVTAVTAVTQQPQQVITVTTSSAAGLTGFVGGMLKAFMI